MSPLLAAQVFDLISGMGIAKSDMAGNAKAIAVFAVKNPGMSLQVQACYRSRTAEACSGCGGDFREGVAGGLFCAFAGVWNRHIPMPLCVHICTHTRSYIFIDVDKYVDR